MSTDSLYFHLTRVLVKAENLLCFDIFDKYSDLILAIRIFEYPFYMISAEQIDEKIGISNSFISNTLSI